MAMQVFGTLLKGGNVVKAMNARLRPNHDTVYIVFLKETSIEVYESGDDIDECFRVCIDQFAFDLILDACVIERDGLLGDALAVLSNSNLITVLSLTADGLSLQRISTTQSVFSKLPVPGERPSRFMKSSPCGRYIAICAYEAILYLYKLDTSLKPCLVLEVDLGGIAWDMCMKIDNAVNQTHIVIFVGVYTQNGHEKPNSIEVITIDPYSIHFTKRLLPYVFGQADTVGRALICVDQDRILCVEESYVTMLSCSSASHSTLCSRALPHWIDDGAEHRMAGVSPLITAIDHVGERVVAVFESGDVYHLDISNLDIQFRLLGVANPATSFAQFKMPLVSPMLSQSAMEIEGELCDVLVLPGDLCNGMVVAINWNSESKCDSPISSSSDGSSTALIRLHDIVNFAPFTDFVLSKSNTVFACSGMHRHGSVLVLEHGIVTTPRSEPSSGFEALRSIFSLKASSGAPSSRNALVLSFTEVTRVLCITSDEGSLEDISTSSGLHLHRPTLAVEYVLNGRALIQVHDQAVIVVLTDTGVCLSHWSPPKDQHIIAASMCGNFVLVAYQSASLSLLFVGSNGQLECIATVSTETEMSDVCSVALIDVNPSIKTCTDAPDSLVVLVGTHSCDLHVFVMKMHQTIAFEEWNLSRRCCLNLAKTSLQTNVPGSIATLLIAGVAYIVIGLRNGSLLRLELCCAPSLSLLNQFHAGTPFATHPGYQYRSYLGNGVVEFAQFGTQNEAPHLRCWPNQLLALCERAYLIYSPPVLLSAKSAVGASSSAPASSYKRVDVVPISLQKDDNQVSIDCPGASSISERIIAAPMHCLSPTFSPSLVCVRDGVMNIVSIHPEQTLTIKHQVRLGKSPQRILFDEETGCVLVACTDWVRDRQKSRLFIVDCSGNVIVDPYTLDDDETVHCLFNWKCADGRAFICVGTASGLKGLSSDRGRVLAFRIISDYGCDRLKEDESSSYQLLKLVSEVQFPHIVYCMTSICDGRYLVCSSADNIHVLELDDGSKLLSRSSAPTRTMVLSLSGYGSKFALIDMRLGVQMYTFNESTLSLNNTKRDPIPRLATRVLLLDEHLCVAIDKYGCIFFLEDNNETSSQNLKQVAFFNMGETASQIRLRSIVRRHDSGDVLNSSVFNTRQSLLVSTLGGSLYSFTPIVSSQQSSLLEELQSQLSSYPCTSPIIGGQHSLYRAPRVGRMNVIDSDLCMMFLQQPKSIQQELVDSLSQDSASPVADIACLLNQITTSLALY